MLRAHVQRIRFSERHRDRIRPVPTFGHISCRLAHNNAGIGLDVTDDARTAVVAGECIRCTGIKNVRVGRMRNNVAALATPDGVHPLGADSTRVA